MVAGRAVGVRFYPRMPRCASSYLPGSSWHRPARGFDGPRHDFEIVVDPSASVEADLERRDFTVNDRAPAVGRVDRRSVPRQARSRAARATHGDASFAEDP